MWREHTEKLDEADDDEAIVVILVATGLKISFMVA
jgi:hypothetical protein